MSSEEFQWTHLVSSDWQPTVSDVAYVENPFSFTHISLIDRFHEVVGNSVASTRFRKLYYRTVMAMCIALGLPNFGFAHHAPVYIKKFKCNILLNVISVNSDTIPEVTLKEAKFQWRSFRGLNDDYYSEDDFPWSSTDRIFTNRCKILRPGIYLVLLDCHVTVGTLCKSF